MPRIAGRFLKLTFAFEVWSVRPYKMIRVTLDASDLLEKSNYEFAAEVISAAENDFEGILAGVLESVTRGGTRTNCPPARSPEF
jgi:hypothetical protein